MKFLVPDWDDRVDPGYDFLTDRFTLKRDPYRDDQYAHEVMKEHVYDGVLVSRMALGETGPKRLLAERIGMRAYLRLPHDLQLLGDSGAFGYIRDKIPRFESAELVDYYGRLGFDLGVSVDHAIVTEFFDQRLKRYDITLLNAESFIREHRRGGYEYIPIGAVQGWDIPSYVEAAKALIAMDYNYLAIGGLARRRSDLILSVMEAVADAVPVGTRLHAFGIARLSLIQSFLELGVTSIDSSSPMRQAWMSATDNYHTEKRNYTALRIPLAEQERTVRDTLVARSEARLTTLRETERAALAAVYDYDRHQRSLSSTLKALMDYDNLLAQRRETQHARDREQRYRETLRDRPWARCKCSICQELGVEVIVFRGTNRNKRRGFHNMFVLQQRLAKTRNL